MSWIDNIRKSRKLVQDSAYTRLGGVVTGSSIDCDYWVKSSELVKRDVFGLDGQTNLVGISEERPAGNFLGTIRAWREMQKKVPELSLRSVLPLCMVFGQGTRLSPFTQALGNRKSALPTPFWGVNSGRYLRTLDLAMLYSSLWVDHLQRNGFAGVLVKWGDEATLPSVDWSQQKDNFADVDLVRCVWKTEPTEVYAREKEWFVINNETQLVERLIPRQPLDRMRHVLSRYESNQYSLAVNLGSVATSFGFLRAAEAAFFDALEDFGRTADWDPAVSYLLHAVPGEDVDIHAQEGLDKAELRFPGLAAKIGDLRGKIEEQQGRPLRVGYMDFGQAFWIDLGLHSTFRKSLEALTEESSYGEAMREFFQITAPPDERGNRIVRSKVHSEAVLTNSIVLDSEISAAGSFVQKGVVVGSRIGRLSMPSGGAALFSAARELNYKGANGIALRAVGDSIEIDGGGRATSIFSGDQNLQMVSNESVLKYDAGEFETAILGNSISFGAAGRLAGAGDPFESEQRWERAFHLQPIL